MCNGILVPILHNSGDYLPLAISSNYAFSSSFLLWGRPFWHNLNGPCSVFIIPRPLCDARVLFIQHRQLNRFVC